MAPVKTGDQSDLIYSPAQNAEFSGSSRSAEQPVIYNWITHLQAASRLSSQIYSD